MERQRIRYYVRELEKCVVMSQLLGDREEAHVIADKLLSKFVEELGYKEVADVYRRVRKWYG